MNRWLIIVLVAAAGWKLYNYSGQVSFGPGVLVPELPYQQRAESSADRVMGDYKITGLAAFSIKAKVLAKKNYYMGREADLSPTDLALGWGRMSDEAVLDQIDISQSGRFYRWRVESFPIPRNEIETHSANMHLIPANDSVKTAIKKIKVGEIIELSGSLVNVVANSDGWRWTSSLTRNDTGNGACELILVENIRTVAP